MTINVLICDDETDRGNDWREEVVSATDGLDVSISTNPTSDEIKEAIKVLLARRHEINPNRDGECIFDAADVLIVDYDLIHIDEHNTRHTGESVARLARAWSKCGVIVVLNQYLDSQFDLGMRGHIESIADLNIDADLVGTAGLWRSGPCEGFRPFAWPTLLEAVERHRYLSDKLENQLAEPILPTLGFTATDARRLSDTAYGFLNPTATQIDALMHTTFVEFAKRNSLITRHEDISTFVESHPKTISSIVVSRITKWLKREVIGPQDVVVDIPHLVDRFPFVLGNRVNDINAWNNAVYGGVGSLEDFVRTSKAEILSQWLGRDVVWLARFEMDENVNTARSQFDFSTVPDLVFAEDTSKFILRESATEFRAAFHNTHDRRHVAKLPSVTYAPQRRFAFGS